MADGTDSGWNAALSASAISRDHWTLFVAERDQASGASLRSLSTTDGGRRFSRGSDLRLARVLSDSCLPSTTCVALVEIGERDALVESTDGGGKWSTERWLPSTFGFSQASVACSTPRDCVVAGIVGTNGLFSTAPGALAVTEDAGKRWSSAEIVPVEKAS